MYTDTRPPAVFGEPADQPTASGVRRAPSAGMLGVGVVLRPPPTVGVSQRFGPRMSEPSTGGMSASPVLAPLASAGPGPRISTSVDELGVADVLQHRRRGDDPQW